MDRSCHHIDGLHPRLGMFCCTLALAFAASRTASAKDVIYVSEFAGAAALLTLSLSWLRYHDLLCRMPAERGKERLMVPINLR
ncbi:hypothetical protein EDB84DRAFT_1459001, partial [Lactarius hengduanensis]